MKKFLWLIIGLFAMSLVACGHDSAKAAEPKAEVKQETKKDDQNVESNDATAVTDPTEEAEVEQQASGDPTVDLDLTALSSTFIYSEVFNMMMSPDDYQGKVIKMEGQCSLYVDENTGKKYYACIVKDATQCCSQGLEFLLDENKYTAEDYPQPGEEITIKGTFSTYKEGENQYITMKDSELVGKE